MEPLDERGRQVQELLGERYEVLGLLGVGGFASVYQVRNRNLERLEALKVLNERRATSAGLMNRFMQEVRAAASLEHPAIVRIHDFGSAGDLLWYTMSFVDGPSLAAELNRHGRLHEEGVARLAVPLLDALAYAHQRGMVHGDIKPGNILLDGEGNPFLSDFGIGRVSGSIAWTAAGVAIASPGYLSPEQLRGDAVDGRSDLYSLGITLYEALTDSSPFDSEEMVATVVQRIYEEAEPLSKLLPGIDEEMAQIVMKSLARDRSRRFAGAREMKWAMSAFLKRAYPDAAVPEPSSETTVRAVPARAPALVLRPADAVPAAFHAPAPRKRARLVPFALAALAVVGILLAVRSGGKTAPAPASVTPTPPPAAAIRGPEPRILRDAPDFVEPLAPTMPPDLKATCTGKKPIGIQIVVGEDGSLVRTKVLLSSGVAACDDFFLNLVRSARYKPAIATDGQPIEWQFSITVSIPE